MKDLRYTLGLDIGIASVGWAVIETGTDGEPVKIERLGVRIFELAENPKDGASLALPRRQHRGQRRTIRRRRHRKERIKLLLEQAGLMTREEQQRMFQRSGFERSVYELRVEALQRALSREEAVRLLIHYAQRRGYSSNSRSEEARDSENGKVKQAISQNQARMLQGGYRTIGEMLLKDESFRLERPDGTWVHVVHNKPDDYKLTATRDMLKEEIETVFAAQRSFGAAWAGEDLEKSYLDIWSSQRNFDEGPGGDSPYGGIKPGKCTFEKEEPRAPKACYTSEYFRLLQTVNNIKIASNGLPPEILSDEQRQTVIAKTMASANVSYAQLRKAFGLSEDEYFTSLSYGKKTIEEVEKKKKLSEMQFYHRLRQALDGYSKGYIKELSIEQLDGIGHVLSQYKSDQRRREYLAPLGLPADAVEAILGLSASKTMHLSIKAMRRLQPYLEQGYTYDKACAQVYGSHDGRAKDLQRKLRLELSDAGEMTNPVVRRAVSQTIKVINAIVREYGPPELVRVELARELGKTKDERGKIESSQKKRAQDNQKIWEQIKEYKRIGEPTGQDIVKFRLYQEQDGVCLYSGEDLDMSRLFEAGYVDVDHIIPYSRSFDDSYDNKVLVLSKENRQKRDRLPYEYFGSDPERWARFQALVESRVSSQRKKRKLLSRQFTEDDARDFKDRNLNDTRYISRLVYNLINDHLQFAPSGKIKKRTQAVNGAVTAHIRKRLGIEKIRSDGDLHHARDAAVIACITPGMTQKVTRSSQQFERMLRTKDGYLDMSTGELISREDFAQKYSPRFPAPWEGFREELEARLSPEPRKAIDYLKLNTYDPQEEILPVFVSRMPRHKVSGPAHKDTIRSGKVPGAAVTKTPLDELKLDKRGEIAGYYFPRSDRLLYEALKARLAQFGGDGKAAFKEPFYKPKADGSPGPLVKKVKILEKATLPLTVRGGIATNDKRVRVDVFHIPGNGYYFVPINAWDTVKKELPNKAVVAHRSYDQWKTMEDKDFLFSIYNGDLIRICSKKGIELRADDKSKIVLYDGLLYFQGLDISNGSLTIETHDNKYKRKSLGGKSLDLIEKYQVDVLGNVSRVRLPEKRQGFGG